MTPEKQYPTDPVSIVLDDGKRRRLRFTIATVRRVKKAVDALGPDALPMDSTVATIWEGILPEDRADLADKAALEELIDMRSIKSLAALVSEAITGSNPESDPTTPASNV